MMIGSILSLQVWFISLGRVSVPSPIRAFGEILMVSRYSPMPYGVFSVVIANSLMLSRGKRHLFAYLLYIYLYMPWQVLCMLLNFSFPMLLPLLWMGAKLLAMKISTSPVFS